MIIPLTDISTESLDMLFNPNKTEKREQDILASQQDAREEIIKSKDNPIT